jgi:hypothetical protein
MHGLHSKFTTKRCTNTIFAPDLAGGAHNAPRPPNCLLGPAKTPLGEASGTPQTPLPAGELLTFLCPLQALLLIP